MSETCCSKNRRKVAMISQPMNGKSLDQIRKEREELVKRLEGEGYKVKDTILNEDTSKVAVSGLWFLGKSLQLMSECDVVFFMPGWELARGCRMEFDAAVSYGMKVVFIGV